MNVFKNTSHCKTLLIKLLFSIAFNFYLDSTAIAQGDKSTDSIKIENPSKVTPQDNPEITESIYELIKKEVTKNWVSIFVSILVALGLLLPGALLQFYLQQWIENFRNSRIPIVKLNQEWLSAFYIADNDDEDPWFTQKAKLEAKRGKIIITSQDKKEKYNWNAVAGLSNKKYLYGTWNSIKSSQSNGIMLFTISMQGDYLYGYYMGSNGIKDYQTGPWVIARTETLLEKAKNEIHNPTHLFLSDAVINPHIRRKWELYHLTQFEGKDIWRHSTLDLSKQDPKTKTVLSILPVMHPSTFEVINYKVDGGTRGAHGIFFMKQPSTESYSMLFFPFMNDNTSDDNYGIIIGQNWDGNKYVGQAILARGIRENITEMGTVQHNLKYKFDQIWRSGFATNNRISREFFQKKLNLELRGTDGIYTEFTKELKFRTNLNLLEIDILAFSLYSVEPKLKLWFDDELLRDMKINLFHIDKDYIIENDSLPDEWAEEVLLYTRQIRKFISDNKIKLDHNNVSINIKPYKHIPAVHGFRVRDSTHFVSFATWEMNGLHIRKPTNDLFIKIDGTNNSYEELALKNLFDNWVQSASLN